MFPGDLVADRLRLVRPLGQGGMGSVWVAEHLTLQTEVAVKFMSSDVSADPSALERFKREARAAAQIKSPHVIKVFDHGVTAAGVPFITMELLSGKDLASLIDQSLVNARSTFPLGFVRTILAQAALGLGAAHKLGIVHRDIKPSNLFVSETEAGPFVYLLDFGIAKRHTRLEPGLTQTGQGFGTPYYMSPEQVSHPSDVDHRSDLWSLAVVAYEALTGAPPFHGETLGVLHTRIIAGHFAPPSTLRPDLPESVDAWFRRSLALEPEARFASAWEMADAFSAALASATLRSGAPLAGDVPGATPPAPARLAWPTVPAGPLQPPQPDQRVHQVEPKPGDTVSPAVSSTTPGRTRSRLVMTPVLGGALLVAGLGVAGTLGVVVWRVVTGSSPPSSSVSLASQESPPPYLAGSAVSAGAPKQRPSAARANPNPPPTAPPTPDASSSATASPPPTSSTSPSSTPPAAQVAPPKVATSSAPGSSRPPTHPASPAPPAGRSSQAPAGRFRPVGAGF